MCDKYRFHIVIRGVLEGFCIWLDILNVLEKVYGIHLYHYSHIHPYSSSIECYLWERVFSSMPLFGQHIIAPHADQDCCLTHTGKM